MNRVDAGRFIAKMLVVWPGTNLPEPTMAYWLSMVQNTEAEVVEYAIEDCSRSCKRFPSVADYQQSCQRGRVHLRNVARDIPALAPVPLERDRVHALIGQGRAALERAGTRYLLANDLDRVGVPDWQVRLSSARRGGGEAFDREWVLIKREYNELTSRMMGYDETYADDRLANTPNVGGHE